VIILVRWIVEPALNEATALCQIPGDSPFVGRLGPVA